MARTTALGIPCPGSGDEYEPPSRAYRAWIRLYVTTRRLRHQISLHDYERWGIDGGRRCTWCGKHTT